MKLDNIKNIWDMISPIVLPVLYALIVWIVGTRLIKILQKVLAKTLAKTNMDISVSKFMQSFISLAAKVLLIIAIIGIMGIPTTGILTVIGSLGLTIGLALQGSLSNFAGGILILIAKPFKVGDYIVEDSHKNEGTVVSIDLLYTRLLTIDNKTVIIPNGTLANTSLTNVTAQNIRRLDLNVGISYGSDVKLAKEILAKIIDNNDKVMQNRQKDIFVKSLDADCVLLETRTWVASKDFWNLKWELTEEFKLAFDREGIQIPFRQIDVHMKND